MDELVGVRLLLVGGASRVVVLSDLVVGLLLKSGVLLKGGGSEVALVKCCEWA